MKRWIPFVFAAAACSGAGNEKKAPPPAPEPKGDGAKPEPPKPTPTPVPVKPDTTADQAPPPQPPDHPPEFFPPAWTKVGVGQTISFGVGSIDPDLDETKVDVVSMPPTAKLDPLTRTITWTPSKKDMPSATFTFHVASLDASGKETAGADYKATIEVDKKKQPAPKPDTLDPLVETVLTIHDPARLAQLNKDWPLDKMLLTAADLLRATLPPEAQKKLARNDRKKLFTSFLAALAQTHGNPRLDPTAKEFDKKVFGDPKAWKIVAVRPRIDKKWAELRIVYQAVKAPEPVFAMFRFRPTWDTPTVPPEARAYNNKVFLDMVAKHLLADGKPSDKLMKDPKKEGKAIAALVKELFAYDDSKTNPWARAGFSALPTEARMGGGTRTNSDGSYRSGDGWAWAVEKPMPNADGTAQAFVDIGIPGFWTEAVPSADGKTWAPHCAPKYDPDDAGHVAGYEGLCRKAQGFVDLPDVDASGKVSSSKKDATNLFLLYKTKDEVALLPIDDGRRDLGEENGMTCSQCHVRNFGVRDYADPATVDPSKGTPKAPNHPIDTLDFQIIPTERWQAFTIEFMKDQACRAAASMTQFLGSSAIECSLQPPK